ncbi:hypothetical protein ACO2E2_04845 [Staphylococcus epidermidis]
MTLQLQSDGGLENTSQSNPISEETTNTLSGQTVPSSTENKQTQNVPNHNAQPIAINTEEAESAQTASYTNINENNDTVTMGYMLISRLNIILKPNLKM